MATIDFKKDDEYTVESAFEFDGEEFKPGQIFKVLGTVTTPVESSYVATEWSHELVQGHDEDGLGKMGHCWDVEPDLLSKHCNNISEIKVNKEEKKIVVPKRLTKEEFKTVLKTLNET